MKYFITDGTAAAFFTAVFDAYRESDCVITSSPDIQLCLGGETVNVNADAAKCERVINGITKYDSYAENEILLILRSCSPDREQIAFNYVKTIMKFKAPVNKRLSIPEVIAFNDLAYKVTGEAHRLKGLLRFMETKEGILYAPYSPDNDITELLMRHFAARFKNEKFIIHDIKRKLAGLYNGSEWVMGFAGEAEIRLSEREKAFESLWKKYYKAVNIKERPHEKQMKGSMPVRYWKFLPEKN